MATGRPMTREATGRVGPESGNRKANDAGSHGKPRGVLGPKVGTGRPMTRKPWEATERVGPKSWDRKANDAGSHGKPRGV